MSSLYIRASRFLEEIEHMVSSYNEFKPLQQESIELKERLNKPLRVAVVGLIKAGKSTLMNALMGEKLLFTGKTETTYKVTWFKYGERSKLIVYLYDGTKIDTKIDDLEFWTVRSKKSENPKLDEVKYIEFYYPSKLLKEMELIDTPGLASTHQIDAQNTMEFLGLDVDEANEVTAEEASKADAIIYAFTKGMHEKDENILKAFQGSLFSNASPINAIGALTKVDIYWSGGYENPLEAGKKVASNLISRMSVKKILYTIMPIAGIIGENGTGLGTREEQIITKLSKMDSQKFEKLIKNATRFTKKEREDIPVTPDDRRHVWDLLDQYGVHIAVKALREGKSFEEVREYLIERSGVLHITNMIMQHFGSRACLIKIQYILSRIKKICHEISNDYKLKNSTSLSILESILGECEKIETEEHVFSELKILQYYYNGEISLDEDEVEELLQITGEYGMNCEARLGITGTKKIIEIAQIAKEKALKWNAKANSSWFYA
ncbi:dynamin family protein [Crassaminicella profunda]|uniref:dynamin family protein n=1 Tax=Crassaminicella profunda TaxID=1286698 RepID=UPI001CA70A1E|nr:dynamin family protein [Crassaminicella profunda]QZY56858.1 dynamin family protein [Crassaminicella profunda]